MKTQAQYLSVGVLMQAWVTLCASCTDAMYLDLGLKRIDAESLLHAFSAVILLVLCHCRVNPPAAD